MKSVIAASLSQLSLNNRPNKKAMWIDCGIHAREWIAPAFCLWFVQHVSTFNLVSVEWNIFLVWSVSQWSSSTKVSVLSPTGFVILWAKPRHYQHPGQHGCLRPACYEPWRIPVHMDNSKNPPNRCAPAAVKEEAISTGFMIFFFFFVSEQDVEEEPLCQQEQQLHRSRPQQKLWCQLVQ